MILELINTFNNEVADAENLPCKGNSFDLICYSKSFHRYPNPYKVLSEVKRVLKKDGIFCYVIHGFRHPHVNI